MAVTRCPHRRRRLLVTARHRDPPTGHLRTDLESFLKAYEAGLATPAARAAIPGLLAAYQADGETSRLMRLSVRPVLVELLHAAPDQVDASLSLDDAFDLILGAVLARVLIPSVASRDGWTSTTADHIARVVRPE